jgi:hypothetical protein
MKSHHKSWLQIAEYASLATSAAGTVVAIASQQVAYAAAPLTLALSLSVVNRQRYQQQTLLHINKSNSELHQVVQSLHQQVHTLPTQRIELNPVTQLLEQMEQRIQTLTHQLSTQQETQEAQINALALRLDDLPQSLEPVDLSAIETEIISLQTQLRAVDPGSLNDSITLLQSHVDRINQQVENLPSPFDPSELEQQLTQLKDNHSVFGEDVSRIVSVITSLQSDTNITEQARISQLDVLALKLESLSISPEPHGLSQLQVAIARLNDRLDNLTQQFSIRSEPQLEQLERVEQLADMLDAKTTVLDGHALSLVQVEQRVEMLQLLIDKIDLDYLQQQLANESAKSADLESRLVGLSEASATKQELNALAQLVAEETERLKGAIAERLKGAIADLPTSSPQFDPLPLTVIQQQLTQVQKSIEDLDASQETLHDRTRNLDQMQLQLGDLERSLTDYAKVESLENVLDGLREEFSAQVDVAVGERVTQLNHLLEEIQPNYKYELVFDRCGSRNVLLEALEQTEQRLILVCPWLTYYGADSKVIQSLEALLQRNVCIDIGWGHRKDIEELSLGSSSIRQKLKSSSGYYNALSRLEALEQRHPTKFKLKLLGTHEKFLICDSKFAMLGSHNFLTSDERKDERELGLRTNDSRIIADLIARFDNAKNLESIETFKPIEIDEYDIAF